MDGTPDVFRGGFGTDRGWFDAVDVVTSARQVGFERSTAPIPQLVLGASTKAVTTATTAVLKFSASAAVPFECRLDAQSFEPCGSGTRGSARYSGLADGTHVFAVRTRTEKGASTSATARWTVDTVAPTVTITLRPTAGTAQTATFRYAASEAVTFKCRLDAGPWSPCGTGRTGAKVYQRLPVGLRTFQVRGVDAAGNAGSVLSYTWKVDAEGSKVPVIAAAGDIACDPADPRFRGGNGSEASCRQMAVSDLLVRGQYDAVLPLGDNQYNTGSLEKYRASYDPSWGRVRSISHPVPGNHEYGTTDAGGYFTYFGPRAGTDGDGWYSWDLGAWHLVALNNECSHIGAAACAREASWLKGDLAAHRNACVLAYYHEPRFSSGDAPTNASATAPFWDALYDAGADVVLNGHKHFYERLEPLDKSGRVDPEGIREFVVGTGGEDHAGTPPRLKQSAVLNAQTFGVLELTLEPTGYRWRYVAVDGTFTDSGTASCHP